MSTGRVDTAWTVLAHSRYSGANQSHHQCRGRAPVVAPKSKVDTVANLAKRRGLVYPSGEIYGGTRSAWDYGPLGVELKENIKLQWWRSVVTRTDGVLG